MSLSRLRLRLAGGFALAFACALAVLAAGALGYLRRESGRRLDRRIESVARGVAIALEREVAETPDSSLAYAAQEVVLEWPPNDDSFVIMDEKSDTIAVADRDHAINAVVAGASRQSGETLFTLRDGQRTFRASALRGASFAAGGKTWRFNVVAYRSTEGVVHDSELLGRALALVAPLIVVLSLAGGYMLARRALRPMNDLRTSIAGIAPGNLSARLPVTEPRDEIGALAAEFNTLLDRLDEAQRRNRRFVREAAHQIRTPLTLVLGEAGYELADDTHGTDRHRGALMRIRMAAEQMRHRVDELMLLAEAQAGEPVALGDDVELDGLVVECTDLMRARAHALGRGLAIGRADPVVIRGNATLLREAVLELIENGCKHGRPASTVTVSAVGGQGGAEIAVESSGEPFTITPGEASDTPDGLGLPIVRWIARGHGGDLRIRRDADRNVATLALPTASIQPD